MAPRTSAASAAPQQLSTPAKVLCDADCQAALKSVEEVKTASGLRYRDIRVGKGPVPPTGYQVNITKHGLLKPAVSVQEEWANAIPTLQHSCLQFS